MKNTVRVRLIAFRLVALMLAIMGLVGCSSRSLPVPNPPSEQGYELGISDNLGHLPDTVRDSRLHMMQQAGIKWLRKDIEWRGAEPRQGQYDWSAHDLTVAAINRFGIKPLLILDYAPDWAAGQGQSDCRKVRCSPANTAAIISAFGAFAGKTAAHYCRAPYNVKAFEIWNEPNISKYWPHPDPALYNKFLSAAYTAIKATSCDATILSGGLGDVACAECYSSKDFLTALYKNGKSFDAVASHPYIAIQPDAQAWQPTILHDIMAANADAHKKVWATEFAYSSRIGTDKQAENMQAAIKTYRNYPWVGPLFWFSMQDTGGESFGLLDSAGSPKPAFETFSKLAHVG